MAKNTYELIFEAVDNTSKNVKRIERSVDSLDKKTKSANSALRRIGSIGGKVAGVLGKLAIAGTATAGAFAFLAKRNLDALDALDKTAGKLGVSTKFLSEYAEVAKEAGLETTQFNVGLQRFLRRLGEAQQGAGTLVKPLKELGISVKDSNGNFRDGTEVFQEYIRKLSGVSNESAKLRLAFSAFDTEGVAFVNVANLGAEAIEKIREEARKAGLSLGDDLTKAAADANDALGNLIRRARGFSLQFFGSLAPGIQVLADEITLALDEAISGAGGMEAFSKDLAADFITASQSFLTGAAQLFDGFTNSVNLAGNVIKRLLVSVSGIIPGVSFELGQDNRATVLKGLNAELDAAQAKLEKFSAEFGEDISKGLTFGGGDMGMLRNFEALNQEIERIQGQIKAVEEDTTIYFELVEGESTMARDAIEKINGALDGQVESLRKGAEEARKEAEIRKNYPVYEDQIIRLAKAYKTDLNPGIEDANDKNKKLNETLKQNTSISTRVIEGIIQNDKNLQSLRGTLAIADEIARKFGISEKVLREELEKQIQAITGVKQATEETDTVRQEATKTLSQFEQFMQELVETSKASVREDQHKIMAVAELNTMLQEGKLNIDQYAEAMSRVKETTRETAEELRQAAPTVSMFQEFMNDLVETSRASVREDMHKSMAVAELNKMLQEGKLNIDTYAEAMSRVKEATKAVADEIEDTAPKISEFDKFMNRLIDNANRATTTQTHQMRAVGKLKEMLDQGKISLDAYAMAMKELGQGKGSSGKAGGVEGLNDALGKTPTLAENIEKAFEGMSSSIASNFTDVIFGLKDGFTALEDIAMSVLRTIIQTMIEAMVKQQMANMAFSGMQLAGLGIFGGIGMLLGGFFANGGNTAKAGRKPIVVGERGPELFLPGRAGEVVSNENLQSMQGGEPLTVQFNINAIDTQTGGQFILENKRLITNVVQDAYRRRASSGPLG
tara:strand:+ start:7747 stop:10623 length:2877 start_codon:yes stop_codon:yes gene_type:complete